MSDFFDLPSFEIGQNIKSFGFKPTPKESLYFKQKLENLKYRCPAHSSIQLTFIKEKDDFIGSLTITGVGKHFRAQLKGKSLESLYEFLEEDIDAQLLEWKRQRVLNQEKKIQA